MGIQVTMPDSFLRYEKEYREWMTDGYPGTSTKTLEFIEHLIQRKEGLQLWQHQKEAILRVIFAYEHKRGELGDRYLLKVVTGGGKSMIIASIISWLRYAHRDEVDKFLVIAPNLIVKDRLKIDFVRLQENENQTVFEKWNLCPDDSENHLLNATVLESGSGPQGILNSDIVLTNIQELYRTGVNTARNLDYIINNVPNIAIFNDEAHNSVADEFTQVLRILREKTRLRTDTTATPERADGTYPDSKLLFSFDITDAMESPKPIIKNIIVFQPEARIVELTYTNAKTNERRKISDFTPQEMEEYQKGVKPFQWVMDPAPMKMLISISLNALEQKKREAAGKFKPLLFVVTMGIEEAKAVKDFLEKEFKVRTLIVTEESSDYEREEARRIGSLDSTYDAVVSVFMLREGWDVSQVSVILLLRKISSPVFGQQIIGRGLRKINKTSPDPEVLFVVDHPMLDHGWLWKMMNVSRIRQDVLPNEVIDEEPLPPRTQYIQKLVNPDKFIKIKEPRESTEFQAQLQLIRSKLSETEPVKNWKEVLSKVEYNREDRIEITAVQLERIRRKNIGKKFGEEVEDLSKTSLYQSSQEVSVSIDDFKAEVLSVVKSLIEEYSLDIMKTPILYSVVMDHITEKLFDGKALSAATKDDLVQTLYLLQEVKKNFSRGIVKGIFAENQEVG